MADMTGGQPDLFEIGRLERQQGQHMVVPARHAAGAPGAPGPHHRGDVGDQRHGFAAAAQAVGHPPAEPGAVDRDDRVRPQGANRGDGLGDTAQQARGMRQHLGEPGDRQLGQRHQRVQARFAHLLAADARDAQPLAGALAQRADQSGAERVSGGLAGDDEDKRRTVAGGHGGTLRRRTPR